MAQVLVLLLALLAIIIVAAIIVGFVGAFGNIRDLRKRTTDIGNVDLGSCEAGQVLRFDGTNFVCADGVQILEDLGDVDSPLEPEEDECLCFNETWGPQGPFVPAKDVPTFDNGTLPCENLPDNGGAPLCNALRWGTPNGTWDADANDPFLSSGGCPFGDFYVVAVEGATPLDGSFPWDVGDALACSATGWKRIGKDILVTSVNGMTGNVSLGLDDMTDVDLTGQANGDFLQRVAGLWTPQQILLGLDDLTDVFSQFAADGDALVFDGATWLPDSLCCSPSGDVAQRFGARASVALFQFVPSTMGGFTTIIFGLEHTDPGGNYNPATGTYQAPFDGYYGAWAQLSFSEPLAPVIDFAVRARLTVNGSPINTVNEFIGNTNGLFNPPAFLTTPVTVAGFFRMNAGDTLQAQAGQMNLAAVGIPVEGFVLALTHFTVVFNGPL